ncbi:transmembrane protein 64-like isoform X2 [Macrobrachium nipponense]|uniref:transmembrane protein 64-like isoform X2 n=1 Tax=Macrobrachium nipponense TaxID=159736 RepID=UPI0030C81149
MKVNLITRWCWRGASVAPSQDGDGVADPGGRNGNQFAANGHLESMAVHDGFGASSGGRSQWRTILTTVGVVTIICVVAYFCRDYIRRVLLWMDAQEVWVVVLVFLALFTVVSFPFTWGYIIINIAAGYMFGTWKGLALTVGTVTLAVMFVHFIIRACLREFVRKQVLKSRIVGALLTVVAGTHAFKVIAVTRLTPIPFGLQNAVFAVSGVSTLLYMTASVIGLLPTQLLNCYLGTTVRNLQDVVSDSSSATATGWIIFSVQIAISIALTIWVIRRAKAELHKTMTAELAHPSSDSSSSSRASSPGNTEVPDVTQNQNGIANIATLVPTSPCHTIPQMNGNLNPKEPQQEQHDQQHLPNSPLSHQCTPLALQAPPIQSSYLPQNMRRHSSSHLNYLAISSERFYDNPLHLSSPSNSLKRPFSPADEDVHCNIDICEGERLISDDDSEHHRLSSISGTVLEAGALRVSKTFSTAKKTFSTTSFISLSQEEDGDCAPGQNSSSRHDSSDDELILLGSMEENDNPV